jgi:hypothetical protein
VTPDHGRSRVRDDIEHALSVEDVESDFGGAKSYEWMCCAIDAAFNPPDGDGDEESLLTEAISKAAAFIEAQPCQCTYADFGHGTEADERCDRCEALGRAGDMRCDQ